MTPTEQTTLQAFLIALAQLETTLLEDLQQDIRQIGDDLNKQPTVAFDKIPELVTKHAQLNDLYKTARLNLQREYQTQQRDKLEISVSGKLALEPMAITMLTADDFQATAKQLVTRVKDSKDAFFKTLQAAVSVTQAKADLKAFSVLKALEFRPLTIENLAYALEMSPDQARQIIQRLWQEGKINTTKAGIFGTIFPFLRPKKRPSQIHDSNTYFTLTSFGYFDLHPVIKVS
ncbi:conserved hypothetical protein [Hyella patelloides LEGE 07179]|uniref:Uncharacterized protein n=1 Tax=Hyella patelloides LEGE 07179 TaxID=945734 RepID=A0A563VL75_9CYAN|nr:hypothetical protein [Hyella patelloides]VEP12083.1 conserved hypothetical protein [Hyella patelloides LEGE 07179]